MVDHGNVFQRRGTFLINVDFPKRDNVLAIVSKFNLFFYLVIEIYEEKNFLKELRFR